MDEDKPNRPLLHSYDGRVLTVREVAEILHVNDSTVRRYINNGTLEVLPIPHVGRKRTLRIRGRSVDKMIGNDTGAT